MTDKNNLSWWHLTGNRNIPITPLESDQQFDVTIVGAGFTGLWTAYYLKKLDPGIKLCILEKYYIGYGASGRNGGWVQGNMNPTPEDHERIKPGSALPMELAIQDTVDEIGRVIKDHNIECGWAKGGVVYPAINQAQLQRMQNDAKKLFSIGLKPEDRQFLNAEEIAQHIRVPGTIGGVYNPHCAVINPFQLVQGIAKELYEMDVPIYEHTEVTSVSQQPLFTQINTPSASISTNIVVMALEAYASQIPGFQKTIVPIHNHVVVTETIDDSIWDEIGLSQRQAFEDGRRIVYYGQRTEDNRMAIGGLSAPYYFNSKIDTSAESGREDHQRLREFLRETFPALRNVEFEHAWSGVLGAYRNLYPSVGFDKSSGFAWSGGYVGQGVATTNLGARTLADLILEKRSDLTQLPWVNHRSRNWESEPLRWLGVKAMTSMGRFSDWMDSHTSKAVNKAGKFYNNIID